MAKTALRRSAVGMTAAAVVMGLATAAPTTAAPAPTAVPAAATTGSCTPPETSVAQKATPTASYTASWNSIAAVSDGVSVFTGGQQNQVWGTYSSNRPASQWLQYTWSGAGTFTGAAVSFWHDTTSDTAGNGVAVPRSWRIQAWVDGAWADVALADGSSYGRDKAAPNEVVFAEPVTTERLRAVFDATTNGTTFAAVAVSEWAVTGEAPDRAGAGLETLTSDAFSVGVSRVTGGVYHLANAADDPFCTNYVENPTQRPRFDVNDSRWVGDVVMRVDGTPRVTGLSDDVRTVTSDDEGIAVSYTGNAANQYGIRGFDLTERYALTGADEDVLDWSISIDNTSGAAIEVEDLSLPMLMNSWWNGGDQTSIYEQNVGRHSFIAQDGSYAYWQRPNGVGPYLVMVPKSGTSLEFRNKARTGEGPFGENDPAWEGLVEFSIHSKALQPEREGKIGGYLPATSLTLPAGGTKDYGFTFRWADSYADLHDVLYDAGVVDAVSLPGMTIPTDQTATLAVRAKGGIESVTGEDGKDITVEPAGERNGYELYELTLPQLGPQQVVVTFDGGRRSVLQYAAVEPVETLIERRADFLVDHQQARTDRGYDGAFLQWDMSREKLVTWDDYPGGGWKQWMAGGSDDLGLAPAAYLAEKNLVEPDQDQVSAIDYYIENFLLGYLQSRTENGERTWQVYRWYDGRDDTPNDQGVWRAYNYTHIANTYLAMYELKTRYPDLDTSFTATEYLTMAYRTIDAMFTKIPLPTPIGDAAHDLGLMGESTYPQLLAALRAEGMSAEADTLRGRLSDKADRLFAQEYPFASEASIDTTGFEANYTLATMFDNPELADKVQSASLASRGLQPLWYYYGSDNRHMGESWWNLGYETQLGAWQQQEYLSTYASPDDPDFDDAMRSTYGAYLGGWANINSGQISDSPANIGAASWQYQSQLGAGEGAWSFMPMIDGWWAWSGEADLGFWGAMRTASVNVVDDDVVGLYGYGGDVTLEDGSYTVVPKDGVRQALTLYTEGGFSVALDGARYTEAVVAEDLSEVSLTLENPTGSGAYSPVVSLGSLPAGDYRVLVDGEARESVTSDGDLTVPLDLTGASHEVRVVAGSEPADTVGPVVTVKDSSVGRDGIWSTVSWKLHDVDGQVDRLTLNGVEKDLTDAEWSDLDGVVPGRFGAVEGKNTLVVTDVAGNGTTVEFALDTKAPTATVKDGSEFTVGRDGRFAKVSFKLHDAGKVDRVSVNGTVKNLSDNVWSDLNFVRPGVFGALEGENTLEVFDVAGNVTTVEFVLDVSGPEVTVKEDGKLTSGSGGVYSKVSFKLHDPSKVDRVTVNGTVKDLTDAVWSDLNGVKKGSFGAVKGENTLVVFDTLGNPTTVRFTLK
ncbi:hypothetical protein KC207_01835 [Phycicoccus sp. BSK3Z-2]|uniref:F5/8 type C domain-containing protein n=1 Tax=Phycicoccus avicenniae TaxID=2828860 RepID=A0A941D5P1_9MICO|nr:DUF5695 domain-containing protein [Phycicoccus avicenniae]MBR7742033.1 hypothetical protein [Phycicoccus avicenniae]